MYHFENYGFYVSNNKLFVIQYEDKRSKIKVLKHLSLKIDDLMITAHTETPNLIFHMHKESSSYQVMIKLDNIELVKELLSKISDVIAENNNDLKIG